jgi:hypothetical protein
MLTYSKRAAKASNGEMKDIYHNTSTAKGAQYLRDEFPELAARTNFLVLTNYVSNWKVVKPLMFTKQENGSMLIRYHIAENSLPQYFVDAAYDTGYFARALIFSEQAEITMLGE